MKIDNTSPDPADLSLTDASLALRARTLGAVEYLSALMARTKTTEPLHHAFAWIDEDRAFDEAQSADRRHAKTTSRQLLHGVPIGVKDLIDVADLPCEGGCPRLSRRVPTADASVVTQVRAQGAIVLGKQRTHELGLGLDDPGTRNAWNRNLYPGGSTAGGAVSVALGSSPAALGTDAGGSVRKPASLNGAVGFKPTHGVISMSGVLPSARTLDHIGLLTRDAADCSLMWRALGGDVHVDLPLRLGWVELPRDTLHPDVVRASEQFRYDLTSADIQLINLEIHGLLEHQDAHTTICEAELAAQYPCDRLLTHHASVDAWLKNAQTVTKEQLAGAWESRARLRLAVDEAMRSTGCDLLVLPTVALPPMRMDELDPALHLSSYTRLTHPFNLTGQPVISIPIARAGAPLPVGMQIVGRRSQDAMVIGAAVALQTRGLTSHETPVRQQVLTSGIDRQVSHAREAGVP